MPQPSFLKFAAAAILILPPQHLPAAPPEDPKLVPRPDLLQHSITGLWFMGQSLCEGSQSVPLVTNTPSKSGALMFKRGVRTWVQGDHDDTPEQRPGDQFALVPLGPAVFGGLGETMANGLADHLEAALPKAKFLVAYAGQGGRTIQELSIADESTDSRTPAVKHGLGGFYKTSVDDVKRATQQARSQGGDFGVAAFVWMQGEANGGATGGIVPSRWLPELPRPAGQEWYRDHLMAYRKQWSDDARAITGQSGEIPLFTYQTLGPAGEAQLMAADRDPYVYIVGPHYAVPSAVNSYHNSRHGAAIHLSADGERWFGEQVAKVMRRVLVDGENWQPLRPRKVLIEPSRTSLLVDMVVPRPPLVLDEKFLPRQERRSANAFLFLDGFRLGSSKGPRPLLTAVEVASPSQLRIRLASSLEKGVQYFLDYGFSDAGEIGIIASIRPGSTFDGQPTTELIFSGDLRERLKQLTDEGAFSAANGETGTAFAETIVRSVSHENGSTVLRFEDRDLRNQVKFAAGQTAMAFRPFAYGNVRDSDPEPAVYSFGDTHYGTRAGQPYPLWNWCVSFSQFPASEK